MKKTSQHYFYLTLIVLLITQYTYSSFTNAEVKSYDHIEGMDQLKNIDELNKQRNNIFLFKKVSDNPNRILVVFKNIPNSELNEEASSQQDSLPLNLLVLEIKIKDNTNFDIRKIKLISSCRAGIYNIYQENQENFNFECLTYKFTLNKTNNNFQLLYSNNLTIVTPFNFMGFNYIDYLENYFLYQIPSFDNEKKTFSYSMSIQLKIEGIKINKDNNDPTKNNFRALVEITLFTFNNQEEIVAVTEKKGSGDLIEGASLTDFFDEENDIKLILKNNPLTLSVKENYLQPKLLFNKKEVETQETDIYFEKIFKRDDPVSHLIPSRLTLRAETNNCFILIVYLFDNNKLENFRFLASKRKNLFYPNNRVLEDGTTIKPIFSNITETSFDIEVNLKDEIGNETDKSKYIFPSKIPDRLIEHIERENHREIIEELFEGLDALKKELNKEKESESNKIKEYVNKFLNEKFRNILTILGFSEALEAEVENIDESSFENKLLTVIDTYKKQDEDGLIEENEELKKENEELKTKNKVFNPDYSDDEDLKKENDLLKEENNTLKLTLTKAEDKIKQLDKDISVKEQEKTELIKKIKTFTETESELTTTKKNWLI